MQPYLNILVAYPYMSKTIIVELEKIHSEIDNVRFLLDSGAFTAFNAGKTITLDDYCTFLESLPFKPWRYFALDVIGDPIKTQENYEIMLKRGFNPVPVFTFGEDLSVIDKLYKTTDYIGVGGLVGVPSNKMLNTLNKIIKKIDGRKYHLLGFTRVEYLKKFKPYSADSSSWEAGARFGTVDVYLNGKLKKLKRNDFLKKPKIDILRSIRQVGIDPKDLAIKENWSGGNSTIRKLSASSWVKMSIEMEKNINVKLFLAFATSQAGQIIREAFKNQTKGTK